MGEFKTGMKLFASVVRENYTKLTLLSVFKKVLLIVGSLLAFREKTLERQYRFQSRKQYPTFKLNTVNSLLYRFISNS